MFYLTKTDLSMTDVVDILIDENIYDDQEPALQAVERAWNELKRRVSWIGAEVPFHFIVKRFAPKIRGKKIPRTVFVFFSQCRNATRVGLLIHTVSVTANRDAYLNR